MTLPVDRRAALFATLYASVPLGLLFGLALRLTEMRCAEPARFESLRMPSGRANLLHQMPLLIEAPVQTIVPVMILSLGLTSLLFALAVSAVPGKVAVGIVTGSVLTLSALFAGLILPKFCTLGWSSPAISLGVAGLCLAGAAILAKLYPARHV